MLTPLSLGWQLARAAGYDLVASPRAGAAAITKQRAREYDDYAWLTVVRLILYVGACSIFARSNPNLSGPVKLAAYVALLFFAELYIVYFCARVFVAQVRGRRDFETLAAPAPFFRRKEGSASR